MGLRNPNKKKKSTPSGGGSEQHPQSPKSGCPADQRDIISWVQNTSLSQEYIIYSPPFEWTAPPHSPGKTLRQRQPKPDWCGWVFGKPSLIFDASTTICTRPNSRGAPLFPNLNCNFCPTLTAHSELTPFSELAESRVQASNPYLIRVLGWRRQFKVWSDRQ